MPDCSIALAGASPAFSPGAVGDDALALECIELALEAGRIGVWDWDPVIDEMRADARARELWGLSGDAKINFQLFSNALHPKDRERSKDVIAAVLDPARECDCEVECRVINRLDHIERWIQLRGRTFFENGRAARVLGAVRNITERKHRERHTRVLLRELVHRSKNLLAVVQAMSRQTAKGATSIQELQHKFGARLQALSVAHDLLVSEDWRGVLIDDLVRAEMAYCLDTARLPCGRICANGPRVMLKAEAAQNIGLALHELATNALVHGALAQPEGCIMLIWSLRDDRLKLEWRESGGPAIASLPLEGFGHTMVKRILAQALGGKATIGFPPNGFVWSLSVPSVNAVCESASNHNISKQFRI